MTPLSLQLFAGAAYDAERAQYQVLGGLQRAHEAFAQNEIYPHLGRLVKLYKALQTVLDRSEAFRNPRTGTIKGLDLDNKKVIYEWPELDTDQMSLVEDFIRWALPHIQDAIEEGRTVYEFVEESMQMEEVGIVPSYVQEGYLMVPDRQANKLHVLRYSLSIFTSAEERYRTLKTVHCKSVPHDGVDTQPSHVKMDLLAERTDLPNPATYYFDTDVGFPYERTMLPIVKRKMMQHLHEQDGNTPRA